METQLPPGGRSAPPDSPPVDSHAPQGVQIYDRPASVDTPSAFNPLLVWPVLAAVVLGVIGVVVVWMW